MQYTNINHCVLHPLHDSDEQGLLEIPIACYTYGHGLTWLCVRSCLDLYIGILHPYTRDYMAVQEQTLWYMQGRSGLSQDSTAE